MTGPLWKLVSCLAFSLLSVLGFYVQRGGRALPAVQICFFQSLIPFVLILASVRPSLKELPRLLFTRTPLVAGGRGLAACIIFATWMLTLRYLPLGLSAAFRLLGPLITFGAAVLFLQEQVSLFRLTALFGACVAGGLLLHTQLTNGLWHLAADAPRLAVLFPIAALFAIAAAHVAGKHLARTASPSAMTHSLLGICTLVFGLFTLPVWVWPQGAQWMLLGVMGLTEWAGQEALSRALSQTDLTLLVPMTLVRFVFMGLAGLLFFHEPVSVFFWGGSVLMACVVVAITRKST